MKQDSLLGTGLVFTLLLAGAPGLLAAPSVGMSEGMVMEDVGGGDLSGGFSGGDFGGDLGVGAGSSWDEPMGGGDTFGGGYGDDGFYQDPVGFEGQGFGSYDADPGFGMDPTDFYQFPQGDESSSVESPGWLQGSSFGEDSWGGSSDVDPWSNLGADDPAHWTLAAHQPDLADVTGYSPDDFYDRPDGSLNRSLGSVYREEGEDKTATLGINGEDVVLDFSDIPANTFIDVRREWWTNPDQTDGGYRVIRTIGGEDQRLVLPGNYWEAIEYPEGRGKGVAEQRNAINGTISDALGTGR